MSLFSIYRKVELFRGLNEEQLNKLGAISQEEVFKERTTIFKQGDVGDKMYIVAKGQVEVRVEGIDGSSHAAVYLGEGQVFGEMALVDSGSRSATIVAVEDGTTVYSIPSDDFTKLCESNTAIGYALILNIAQDLSFKLRHRDYDPSQS